MLIPWTSSFFFFFLIRCFLSYLPLDSADRRPTFDLTLTLTGYGEGWVWTVDDEERLGSDGWQTTRVRLEFESGDDRDGDDDETETGNY